MSLQNPDLKVYCRIEDGKVVEYPVYAIHIANRSEPVSNYNEVEFDEKPEADQFSVVSETYVVGESKLYVGYNVRPKTLSELLADMNKSNVPQLRREQVAVNIADVDPLLIQKVVAEADAYISKKLADFVKTRGYESVVSAVSWVSSTVARYRSDATRIIELRDSIWPSMNAYLADVLAGNKPVPKTLVDIDGIVPEFTWTEDLPEPPPAGQPEPTPAPVETPAPTETPTETPVPTPAPSEEPVVEPVTETPAPVETPVEEPAPAPTETPVEETPAPAPTETPTDEPSV